MCVETSYKTSVVVFQAKVQIVEIVMTFSWPFLFLTGDRLDITRRIVRIVENLRH